MRDAPGARMNPAPPRRVPVAKGRSTLPAGRTADDDAPGRFSAWRERHLFGDRPPYGLILIAFVVISVVLTAAVTIAGKSTALPAVLSGPAWLDSWFGFDAGWYYRIATEGYSYTPDGQSSIAFFPTYPVLVHLLGSLIGDYQIAGTIIAVAGGMVAVCLFAAWVWPRLPRPAAVVAVAFMMLYPYSFFLYGPMYSDSTFLVAVFGSFLLLERRLYWLAGLVGILATAGRPVGIAVTIGLVVRMLELRARDRQDLEQSDSRGGERRITFGQLVQAIPTVRWREMGVLVSGLGLAGWCAYLWIVFGDPLIWIEAQAAWGQGSGPSTWFKLQYFDTLFHGGPWWKWALTGQLIMCGIAVAMLPAVRRRFGLGYLFYAVTTLAIPLIGTKDFYGVGRYVLAAFPVVAAGSVWLVESHRRWVIPLLVASALGMVFCACLFAMGLPVS